jgi:hypothetical protein
MRWFRRKKEEKSENAVERQSKPSAPEGLDIAESTLVSMINPVHAFIKRLEGIITDDDMEAKTKALQDTRLQLIVGGEALLLSKEGVKPLAMSHERSVQSDVFIRMSEQAAGQLAMTSTFQEFKKEYKQMVGVKGAASYISIKLHTPLEELRQKGYFSVEFLRTLIDA